MRHRQSRRLNGERLLLESNRLRSSRELSSGLRYVQNGSLVWVVNFSSKDRDLSRGLDSDFDDITVDPGYFDVNVIADYDSLLHSS
jgi:hypothetical protein